MVDRPPIPENVRRRVFARCRRRCEDCGRPYRLELHHLRYHTDDWRRESILGKETPNDLAALCRWCHHQRHIDPNGEFWADPQEMAEHWATK